MKKITLFLFFVLNFACYSSNFNDNVILSAKLGVSFLPNKTLESDIFTFNNSLSVLGNISAFVKIRNNWYLNLETKTTGQGFDIDNSFRKTIENDFYVIDASGYNSLWITKSSLLIGGVYKFDYKRLAILPYCNIGLIFTTSPKITSYLLKEKGSNNIRKIENENKMSYSKVDFSLGTKVLFYLGKYGGLSGGIKYDRFKYHNTITSKTSDYFMLEETIIEKSNFTHNHIFLSAGFFLSF